jgi:hypothetical protein
MRIIAPPTPHTTPMMVFLVLGVKPEEVVWFSPREAGFVELEKVDEVEEE